MVVDVGTVQEWGQGFLYAHVESTTKLDEQSLNFSYTRILESETVARDTEIFPMSENPGTIQRVSPGKMGPFRNSVLNNRQGPVRTLKDDVHCSKEDCAMLSVHVNRQFKLNQYSQSLKRV